MGLKSIKIDFCLCGVVESFLAPQNKAKRFALSLWGFVAPTHPLTTTHKQDALLRCASLRFIGAYAFFSLWGLLPPNPQIREKIKGRELSTSPLLSHSSHLLRFSLLASHFLGFFFVCEFNHSYFKLFS